jgi:hypothetical protein
MNKKEEQKLLKLVKPKKFDVFLYTLISLSPLINLLMDLDQGDTKKLTMQIILSILGIFFLFFIWNDYKLGKKIYKGLQDHFKEK